METVDGESLVGTEPPNIGEKLLKRLKRGWMWNQFFLQEEYTGSDYQYIGKVRDLLVSSKVGVSDSMTQFFFC